MADDDLAATLAGIRERAKAVFDKRGNVGGLLAINKAKDDVPLLVAAVEAVLKEHQPVNRGEDLEPICGTCHRGFWPCPTYLAITAALTGKEAGDEH